MSDTPKDAPRTTALAPRAFSLMPQSLGEAKEIAALIANSDFAPKDYKGKPDNVIVALQMGADLGLKPMQALQNIAVINGRPSIYGDAALALVMPALERFVEFFEGTEGTDDYTAVCIAKRKGWPDETRRTFSIKDAKAAKLWGKQGPWTQYEKRMLQFRARGFTLRDVGADLLLGLVLAEEAQDYPPLEGIVVSSEVVPLPKALTVFEQLPEAVRDNVEKAFTTLNMAPGARLAKLNEYFGGETVNAEEQATALLDWCRDEYAKRKTGQPRKQASNAKTGPETPRPATDVQPSPESTHRDGSGSAEVGAAPVAVQADSAVVELF